RVHHEDVEVAVSSAGERDALSVGRPRGPEIASTAFRHLSRLAAVERIDPDLEVSGAIRSVREMPAIGGGRGPVGEAGAGCQPSLVLAFEVDERDLLATVCGNAHENTASVGKDRRIARL